VEELGAMEEMVARFIDRTESRYWGTYRGLVEDRDDPEKLGRLRVKVPSVLGDVISGWAWPVVPYAGKGVGFFFLPQKGDLVIVEFLEGELEQPLWTGCSWGMPQKKSELPTEALNSYPKLEEYVIKTPAGSTILISDKSGSETITIRAKKEVIVEASSVLVQSTNKKPEELATKTFVKDIFDKHVHPSGVGPTGTPNPPSNPKSLTTVLKAE
jgi:uncharacterized protein involved in type VI secretion and phage assembly